MKKLLQRSAGEKIAYAVVLFLVSFVVLSGDLVFSAEIFKTLSEKAGFIGYFSLFGGLFIIFEGFGFTLFKKIIIAVALGLFLAFLSLEMGLFVPAEISVMKPVGSKIFMNCLTMALVPLVFCSILTGVTSLGDINRLNVLGFRTIIYYVITTGIAITIGLTLANMFQPGKNLSPDVKTKIEQKYMSTAASKANSAEKNRQTLFEGLQAIFPKNIFHSISASKPEMLALIFFALICGVALLNIEDQYSEPVIKLCTGITEMTVRIVIMVMRLAPYGVFTLIAAAITETESFEIIAALIPFSLVVVLGLLIHMIGMNSVSLAYFSKKNVGEFFRNGRAVMITAFSTSSSGATMPLTLETTEKVMGVRNEVAGFVVPLGATINMDGTALFQGISAIFLANIYGIDLSLADQLTIVGMTVMASIGTAAVPGVGVVILTMILVSVGIPAEGILFILPVNNLLDMCRTAVNVTGDMACAVYIDAFDKRRRTA